MSYFSLLLTAGIPWVVLLVPGVVLPRFQQSGLAYFSRAVLWSVSIWTLVSFFITWLHLPPLWVVFTMVGITGVLWWWHRPDTQWWSRQDWPPLIFLAIGYLFFGIFFWYAHNALPTGDSQKAIYWGGVILQERGLPDYQAAVLLN